jgi:hypothetical protein
MSGEDREGEALTASAMLARWESLRRPGEPERLPLEPGSAYEIDREGAVFRVSPPEPPKRLEQFDRKTAENRAAADWDFDPKRWRHHRERPEGDWVPLRDLYRTVPPCAIVSGPAEDRWAEVVRIPSAEDRKPITAEDSPLGRGSPRAWASGGRLPAAGDIDRGWFLLRMPDGSSLLFHGPSKAAEVFGRSRESSAPRRGR